MGGRTVYAARILLKDKTRAQLRCKVGFTREEAERDAAKWQAKEDRTNELYLDKLRRKGVPVDGESADKWFARMLPLRAAALHTKDTPELTTRWNVWVSPAIGPTPLAAVTREQLIEIRDALDKAASEGRIQPKTALNVWSCVRTAFRVACSTKGWAKGLRVLTRDLTADIEPVDRGASRKRQWLYPTEFAQLMACVEVPVERRFLYACAAYTGLRPDELVELRWKDVDFVAGVVRVARALDWKSGKIGPPKTEAAFRAVPIEPSLLPALKLYEGEPEAFVVPRFSDDKAARIIREDLKAAGVNSARLQEKTATHLPVDFRCLRDSYATWSRLRRDPPDLIMARMGHEDIATTFRYTKVAETVGQDVGTPFAPLPWAPTSVTASVTLSELGLISKCRRWDLNALSGAQLCTLPRKAASRTPRSDHFCTPQNRAFCVVTLPVTLGPAGPVMGAFPLRCSHSAAHEVAAVAEDFAASTGFWSSLDDFAFRNAEPEDFE